MNTKTYEEVLNEQGYLFWKTVGVSMKPLIKEGRDMVVIKKRPEGRLEKYDVVLFRRPGVTGRGAYVLHRILKVNPAGTYWIVGDNCSAGETVKEENVLGILTEVKRKNREIKVTDFGYRVYTHLWCDVWPVRFFFVRYGSYPRRAAGKVLRKLGLRK